MPSLGDSTVSQDRASPVGLISVPIGVVFHSRPACGILDGHAGHTTAPRHEVAWTDCMAWRPPNLCRPQKPRNFRGVTVMATE